jgi:hypothetical protein
MAVISESAYLADLVKFEESHRYSRKLETVASGQNLDLGAVVGLNTTDGKIYALNPAAADGTQTAVGVLIESVDATLLDKSALILARHAIVADKALLWPAGITNPQKIAALAQLEALGVLVYQSA